jgi:hypothetical protein
MRCDLSPLIVGAKGLASRGHPEVLPLPINPARTAEFHVLCTLRKNEMPVFRSKSVSAMHSPGASLSTFYGHTLDWTANEDAAKRLGEEIAKAVAELERKQQLKLDSGHLSAHQKENSQAGNLGSK